MTRAEEIRAKGFDMRNPCYFSDMPRSDLEYKKIKVGVKSLDDATLNLGSLFKALPRNNYINKSYILKVIAENNIDELRNISHFYYNINGIYRKVCDYAAFLYRYDWYVAADVIDTSVKEEKVDKEFHRILNFLDNSHIRKICGDIALSVVQEGCYYGYIVPNPDGLVLQQLPVKYCRSRYSVNGSPAVEFDMRFFDTFRDPAYRMKVLQLFPDEFVKGYMLYKKGKLVADYPGGNTDSWYLLEPGSTVKFNINGSDTPMFITVIPALLDLDAAQDLDRRKQMQKLLKIVIQKLPLDKNGDLIFDVDEARDIHNNAVDMLRRAIGVDVLTTFADVEAIDMSDKNTSTTVDDLSKVERTVFNNLGISRNLFNTDGNLSLEKSILNDESSLRNLLLQFEIFFDRVTRSLNTNKKKYTFKLYMLETTQYNYKELSKLYKEHAQMGYSKMLPQIALGHSQSFILDSMEFENEILHLSEIMIPPLMSSTLNGQDILGGSSKTNNPKAQDSTVKKSTAAAGGGNKPAGRPEKADDQKSAKTIANKESMS